MVGSVPYVAPDVVVLYDIPNAYDADEPDAATPGIILG